MSKPKVLLIEGCDFETFPVGGQLSMARSLIKLFGNSFALVGTSSGDEPVGQWRHRTIDGTSYLFFSVLRRDVTADRPRIPVRLTLYLALQRYRRQILSVGCDYALVQAPEALFAVSRWGLQSLCFIFPGVENPLRISRYRLARRLCRLYDAALFSSLDRVAVILASADEQAIRRFVTGSRGRITREKIVQLPTCVDLSEFRPRPVETSRKALGIPLDAAVFVASGRIGHFKGWQLLLDAFALFQRKHARSLLLFVGDGEDRPRLDAAVAAHGIGDFVRVTGFCAPPKVAAYLNAADAVVVGSLAEGWSVAMVEALACGKPLVTTPVSGAGEMIVPGRNGFIVQSRNPDEFAAAMEKALLLTDASALSAAMADRFSLTRMRDRLAELWFPLRAEGPERLPMSEIAEAVKQ